MREDKRLMLGFYKNKAGKIDYISHFAENDNFDGDDVITLMGTAGRFIKDMMILMIEAGVERSNVDASLAAITNGIRDGVKNACKKDDAQ